MKRRNAIQILSTAVAASGLSSFHFKENIQDTQVNLKTSLNAYSFNKWLKSGQMTLDGLLEFCSKAGFDAIDLTGYYLQGYPKAPADDYIFEVKRKAHKLGLDISGTGVRNDFTLADQELREQSIQHVLDWVDVAAKLGAPVLRVFAGRSETPGFDREEVLDWVVDGFRKCTKYAETRGVILAVQNHNHFIKTPAQTIEIIKAVDSDWFGLVLDTGSYRQGDLYANLEKMAPYAVNWQVKEEVTNNGQKEDIDLTRLVAIVKNSSYRGYLPIETFGESRFDERVTNFLGKLNKALSDG